MENEEEPEGSEVKAVYIVTTHVIEHANGTFEVLAYDETGGDLAHTHGMKDAADWCDALIQFWPAVYEAVKRYKQSPFN